MKKFVCVMMIVAFTAALFTGCNRPRKVPESVINNLDGNFSCVLKTEVEDTAYAVRLTKSAAQQYQIELMEPENLNKLRFGWNGSEVQVGYADASFGLKVDDIPQSSFVKAIFLILDNAVDKSNLTYSFVQGGAELYGKTLIGAFTVRTDSDFIPYQIELPQAGIVLAVSEFQTLE